MTDYPLKMKAVGDGDFVVRCGMREIIAPDPDLGNLEPIGSIAYSTWRGLAVMANGDVWGASYTDDIYIHYGGEGPSVALGQGFRGGGELAVAPNGDIYACNPNVDIFKMSGGTGNLVALGANPDPEDPENWRGVTVAPNGDVYACSFPGDIYKSSNGGSSWTALEADLNPDDGIPPAEKQQGWFGMAAAPNGDIYCSSARGANVLPGDIYKSSNGGLSWTPLGQGDHRWYGMAAAPNGDIYVVNSEIDIYIQKGGSGNFTALGFSTLDYWSVACGTQGDVYVGCSNGAIYRRARL